LQSKDAIGGPLLGEKEVWVDEGKCLNLAITVLKVLLEGEVGRRPRLWCIFMAGGLSRDYIRRSEGYVSFSLSLVSW
jgi:hypothetical protein